MSTGRFDSRSLEAISRELREMQQQLEAAWNADLSDPANGDALMQEIAVYNERVDAMAPRIAEAAGVETYEIRDRFGPKSDQEAYFGGSAADFLEASAHFRSLDPDSWDRRRASYQEQSPVSPERQAEVDLYVNQSRMADPALSMR